MSGIECVNLLAFIQFIVAFNFGLYYFDDKHTLTKIYRKYQMDLRSSTQAILDRAADAIKATLKREDASCMLKGAHLDKVYRRLKYLTDEGRLLEGCGFIGLYAGLYGFLCLFCIGMFGSKYEASVKTYILVTSQIVLATEALITLLNFSQESGSRYSRNIWSNIKIILFILILGVGISSIDWTFKLFSEFELPFVVISLIVLLFPLILFTSYIIVSRIIIMLLKRKCKNYIYQVEESLQTRTDSQD